jgi:hypothetical protein
MESEIKQLLVILTPLLFMANLVQSFFYLPEADRREGGSICRTGFITRFFSFSSVR